MQTSRFQRPCGLATEHPDEFLVKQPRYFPSSALVFFLSHLVWDEMQPETARTRPMSAKPGSARSKDMRSARIRQKATNDGRVPRSKLAERARVIAHIDLAPAERPPATGRLLIAAVMSIGASVGADAALVAIGTHLFPSTNGFSHF